MSIHSLRQLALIIVSALLGVFLQSSALPWVLPDSFVVPNLMLAMVAFLAFYEVSPFGALLAFLTGLVLDLSSGVLLGPWAAAFVAVYGFLSVVSQRIFVESTLSVMSAVFAAALLSHVVYASLLLQFSHNQDAAYLVSVSVLGEALFSAFLAPLVFYLLKLSGFLKPSVRGSVRVVRVRYTSGQ